MTAMIAERDNGDNPSRFVFTDVKEVVLVRDGNNQWTLWVDDVELRLAGELKTYGVHAWVVGFPKMTPVPEPTLPAEQEVKPNG